MRGAAIGLLAGNDDEHTTGRAFCITYLVPGRSGAGHKDLGPVAETLSNAS